MDTHNANKHTPASACPGNRNAIANSSQGRIWYWCLSLSGLISLAWFLIRVIPKPSRAAYPCMRVAAPMASSFVVFLLGILGSAFAFRKARQKIRESRQIIAVSCAALAVMLAGISLFTMNQPMATALNSWTSVNNAPAAPVANDPIGTALGANEGRVSWVHDPESTDWDGPGSGSHWWEGNHTDQARVDVMVSKSIQWLTGKRTDAGAWSALFKSFNQMTGNGSMDYAPGEKVVIKVNLTTCNCTGGGGSVNPTSGEKTYYLDKADTTMHIMLALLRQLVNVVGVAQSDISIGDTLTRFPNQWYDHLAVEFPNVHYLDHYGTLPGRTGVAHSTVPFYWSTTAAAGKVQDYIPVSFAEATYLINVPVMKGHGVGITVGSKNHYGSFVRSPVGREWGVTKNYYNLHDNHAAALPGTGHYRPQVDMMGFEDMGGKTLLVLMDALYCGYYWEGTAYKWNMPPFNNDWPSSVFASQDQVAIDSVAYDFLEEEWPDVVSGGEKALGGATKNSNNSFLILIN